MRGSIDCAVLMVPEHTDWMLEFVRKRTQASERVKLHCVALDGTSWVPETPQITPPGDALRRCATGLMRYDVCLLPVTLATLGWTRMALASADGMLETPVLAIARGMSAAGLQDLLSLGLTDFLRAPVCNEEFKIRLEQCAFMSGKSLPAPRPALRLSEPDDAVQDFGKAVSELFAAADNEPFRSAKARVVTEFERHYVSEMLSQHKGNISQAARAARKNRRAFWQLMRKHEIAADVYRSVAAT